jgi:sugar lactone lactonase YvrE
VGTITAGISRPYGLWVDKHKSLYVANQENSTVTKYLYGSITPAATYSQGLSRPLYPIVDSKGDLFVGNANTGTVVEYKAKSRSISRVFNTAGTETDGLAFDRHGNLFVAYRVGRVAHGSIEEFAGCGPQGQILGMDLDQPQGIVIDKNRNIVATETGGASRVDVFRPGSTSASLEVPLPNRNTPTEVAIDRRNKHIYVSSLSGSVFEIKYPFNSSSFIVKDQVSETIQGVMISNNQAR